MTKTGTMGSSTSSYYIINNYSNYTSNNKGNIFEILSTILYATFNDKVQNNINNANKIGPGSIADKKHRVMRIRYTNLIINSYGAINNKRQSREQVSADFAI